MRTLRWVGQALLVILGGALSVHVGKDVNGDQLVQHAYGAAAFLNGTLAADFAAAGIAGFNNPLLYVPWFLGTLHLPDYAVGFLIGAIQALNGVLVWRIALLLLDRTKAPYADLLAVLAVVLTMLTPNSLLQFGRTFGDNWASVFFLAGVYLTLLAMVRAEAVGARSLPGSRLLFAGMALVGAAGALKYTNLPYALMFGLALLAVLPRPAALVGSACAMIGGFLLVNGWWMAELYSLYGNPLFPYLNRLFESPFAVPEGFRDTRWMFHGWQEMLRAPLSLFDRGERHIEGGTATILWVVLFAVLAIYAIVRMGRGGGAAARPLRRFLMVFVVSAFVLWALMFAYSRYLMVLEPFAIVLVMTLMATLMGDSRRLLAMAAAVSASILATQESRPMEWSRVAWTGDWHVQGRIDLPAGSVLLSGVAEVGFIRGYIPETVVMVGHGSNFFGSGLASDLAYEEVRKRVREARGPVYSVRLPPLPPPSHLDETEARLGLEVSEEGCFMRELAFAVVQDGIPRTDSQILFCPASLAE